MNKHRVIVIGGGPAGLMAAGQAAKLGAETLLFEKMDRPGRKLRITGKGRCNLTNRASLSQFIEHFRPNGQFLRQAFSQFFTSELLAFFEELGISTVTERGGRVFPVSGRAQDVVDALTQWIGQCGVKLRNRSTVEGLKVEGKKVVVLAGTGPVGQRVAALLAKEGAQVILTSRKLDRVYRLHRATSTRANTTVGRIKWRSRSNRSPSPPRVNIPPEGSQPSRSAKMKIAINPNQKVGNERATIAPVVAR